MKKIDLNVDIGEGFLFDEELLKLVSSCNIACGGHTGNEISMRATLRLAKENATRVGAHPSYPDTEFFGRKVIEISNEELTKSLKDQITTFIKIANEEQIKVTYVKPHGALYNRASVDLEIANLIVKVIASIDKDLALMGQPNSVLENVAKQKKIAFIREGFADRAYLDDGALVPRIKKGAVLHRTNLVINQVLDMIQGTVFSIKNNKVDLDIDSICFHGDTPEALELVREVVATLELKNIKVQA